jgi:hypothetical protein
MLSRTKDQECGMCDVHGSQGVSQQRSRAWQTACGRMRTGLVHAGTKGAKAKTLHAEGQIMSAFITGDALSQDMCMGAQTNPGTCPTVSRE